LTLASLALLFGAGVLAGGLNSVVGGGTFVGFPALLFVGVAPVAANATNTIALWPGGVASAYAYRLHVRLPRATLATLGLASAAGGAAGALLLLRTPERSFVRLIPWLLLVATALFTAGRALTARLHRLVDGGRALAQAAIGQLLVSVYGGYFGGGVGILMLALFAVVGEGDMHALNGLRLYCVTLVNGAAIVLFLQAHTIAWRPGLAMVAGATAGGYLGAAAARRVAPERVRRVVLVVAWGLTAYFFARAYG
jgi:uncharacterized membrane protein YfcA